MSRGARRWWISGLVLLVLNVVLAVAVPDSCPQGGAIVLLVGWVLGTLGWSGLWLWRKLTYRLSVRLLLSYLLVGVIPFLLLSILFGCAAYVFLGQYASSQLGTDLDAVRHALNEHLEQAVTLAGNTEEIALHLAQPPPLPPDLEGLAPRLAWAVEVGSELRSTARPEDASLPGPHPFLPAWAAEGAVSGLFLKDGGPIVASVVRHGDLLAALLLPLDPSTAERFNAERWYEAQFLRPDRSDPRTVSGRESVELPQPAVGGQGSQEISEAGPEDPSARGPSDSEDPGNPNDTSDPEDPDEIQIDLTAGGDIFTGYLKSSSTEPAPSSPAEASADLWDLRWIFSLRVSPGMQHWEDGATHDGKYLFAVVRTSPHEALATLFRSPYEFGRGVWQVFAAMIFAFSVIYFVAVSVAGIQIFSITRAGARLTHGTRAVQEGDLGYRIPVLRRDQLGDLALAFNEMTASVEVMLEEVAEKERLQQELELAREIQQSLLPGRHLRHGGLTVHAFFQPAAEVGGDYFDLFPLPDGRLLVSAGDVAGHGLSTGLLMAMVKSAVATLVREGHRGVALLERLNRLMLEQPREHRMLTLAIADIDPAAGTVEVTNAAHPPIFLAGGAVREVMLPALPVGFTWRTPPPSTSLALEPGTRLIFYSDGLVEAVDRDDHPFGYDRLRELLEGSAERPAAELLQALLAALEEHTGGRPLDDDLTILVIDCGETDLGQPD